MSEKTAVEQEALDTYARFVALRERIDAGEATWDALADFFTEDAAYIDPAWGRIEGREGIRNFFVTSMKETMVPMIVGGTVDQQKQQEEEPNDWPRVTTEAIFIDRLHIT